MGFFKTLIYKIGKAYKEINWLRWATLMVIFVGVELAILIPHFSKNNEVVDSSISSTQSSSVIISSQETSSLDSSVIIVESASSTEASSKEIASSSKEDSSSMVASSSKEENSSLESSLEAENSSVEEESFVEESSDEESSSMEEESSVEESFSEEESSEEYSSEEDFSEEDSGNEEYSKEESSFVEESVEDSSEDESFSEEDSSFVEESSEEEDSVEESSEEEDSSIEDEDSSIEEEELENYVLSYTLNYDETYYICNGIDENSPEQNPRHVVIPDTYNGIEVCEIADAAFVSNPTLHIVTLGKNVNKLGENAVAQCYNLFEIYNLSTDLTIKFNDYENGMVSSQVKVYTDLNTESAIYYVDDYIIYEGLLIGYQGEETELSVPNGVVGINSHALSANIEVTSITLPNTVTTISSYAFKDCENLTTVILGSGLQRISVGAFEGSSLTSLQFHANCMKGWSSGQTTPLTEVELEDPEKTADIIMGRLSEYGVAYQGTWSRS